MNIVLFIFRYIATWILLTIAVIVLLAISESASSFLLMRFNLKNSVLRVNPVKLLISTASSPILLPAGSSRWVSLIMPVFAIAALSPVCASVSLFSLSPLATGGDILQILHFMILSVVCSAAALCALGTKQAFRSAARLAGESAKLICALMAAFASFAVYFIALGVQGNSFGMNAFTLSLHMRSLGILGYMSLAVFIFLALSHSSYWEESCEEDFFSELSVREYNGLPRAMLQIWMSFKVFLIAVLVSHIFFPWFLFRDADTPHKGTFWLQALGFVLFWLTAIAIRAFGVTLCRKARSMLEQKMSPHGAALFMLLLACAAIGIIYYEAHISALEAY